MNLPTAFAALIEAAADIEEETAECNVHYEDQSRVAALLYIGMLTLPALQRKVLQGLYGEEPRTITDLSREFKISAAQVKEERDKALQNMRRYFCENPLPARPAL